ncbi:MAG TPA: hypothetical protein VF053_12620 [Streptosporangiales bacterium]
MALEPSTQQDSGGVGDTARATADTATTAAGEVAGTAKDQTRRIAEEARDRARDVGGTIRDRMSDEADSLARRAVQSVRTWSDELESMAEGQSSSTGRIVGQVAARGRSAADYVDDHGVHGLVDQVQSFARRRPGLFLMGAAAAGFAVARLAKAAREEPSQPQSQPQAFEPADREPSRPAPLDDGALNPATPTPAGR